MNVNNDWLKGKVTDDQMFNRTEKLTNSKNGKSLILFSGSYLAQHVDYGQYLDNPSIETMGINMCFMIPGAHRFTYMMHASRGYSNAFSKQCTTFTQFCREFKGTHLFCTNSKYWNTSPPTPREQDVIEAIKKNKISNFCLFTRDSKTNINDYKLSKIPKGIGGTLNGITLPFAIKMGYDAIYAVGIGDKYLHHFTSPLLYHFSRSNGKQHLINRELALTRYKNLRRVAEEHGTQIYVMPTSMVEPSIAKIFKTADKIV